MFPIVSLAGLAAGLVLGLVGSGGAIITLPALTFLLSVPTKPAVAMSLGIVGITSSIAALTHWRRHHLNLRVAAIFGIFSAGGSFLGARMGVAIPAAAQLVLFAAVMYVAAWLMYRPLVGDSKAEVLHRRCAGPSVTWRGHPARTVSLVLMAIGVGMLSGLVGLGGGFLIVPALVLKVGLPMREAVGTSLAIVAGNAFVGFGHYVTVVSLDLKTMAAFTGLAVTGSVVGALVSDRVTASSLKRFFAVFLATVATYILARQGAVA